jgi:hypothetical protein
VLSFHPQRPTIAYLRLLGSLAMCMLVAMVFIAGNARAGSLALVSCDGSSANEGWKTFFQGNVSEATAESSCSERWTNEAGEPWAFPAGMEASLQAGTRSDARVGLEFVPPEGESIVGGDITVGPLGQVEPPFERVRSDPGAGEVPTKRAELALVRLENVFWVGVDKEPSTVTIPSTGGPLYASVLCGGEPGGVMCSSQTLYVPAAHILLSPRAEPSVSAISGSLTAAGVVHGTQAVSFNAYDTGGPGVYQVTVAIDGKTIYQATPNLNGGVCAPAGTDGSSLEFYTAEPCPQSVPMTLPVHTSTLPDGIHSLTVTATDAASNVSTASQVIFRSENLISTASAGRVPRPQSKGIEPAYLVSFDGKTSALLHGVRRTYADSSLTLSGTLATPQGAVAPDVPIELLAREGSGTGGAERVLASTTTDAGGHWSLIAPKGPSRTLRVSYSQASAASVQAGATIKESVNPTMSLRIHDQHGGHLTFTGTVAVSPLGHPLPLVLIEASGDGRHWQTVGREVRTNSHGEYKLSFSSPLSVGGRFAFRAITPETSLWLQGDTGTRWVKVH